MSDNPLYRRLADEIEQKIISGEIETKLPAIRAFAEERGVNNSTVVAAYKLLEQKRVVYSVRGSGTFVSPSVAGPEPARDIEITHNFSSVTIDPAYFPANALRNAFDTVLARDGAGAFDLPGQFGYEPLREALAKPVIISGVQHGIEIIEAIFGTRTVPCSLENLKNMKIRPKIFFFSYRNTGEMCYNDKVQEEILRIARDCGAYVVEADYFGDLYYGRKMNTFAEKDPERVIYLKSFDRILAPGLLNFMHLPKGITLRDTPEQPLGYIQRGMEFFIRNGGLEEHLMLLRSRYLRKYRKMSAAMEAYISPLASYTIPGNGLSFHINIRHDGELINKLLRRKVLVMPAGLSGFRLGFGSIPEEKIAEGIGIIASVLREY